MVSLRGSAAIVSISAALLASCASAPVPPAPAPAIVVPAPVPEPAPPAIEAPPTGVAPPSLQQQPRSRWVEARWSDLPGWQVDRVSELWPALLRSCAKPTLSWKAFCEATQRFVPPDDESARAWLAQHLVPYRVEALDGNPYGLATGYYEPHVAASRQRAGPHQAALHAPPPDLGTRRPWWTRQEIDTLPAAQSALRGLEIAWVDDPLDALALQIQGSGRVALRDEDGRVQHVRMAYAGHNGQGYQSVGRWLIEQGELKPGEASWPAIRAWARLNPWRINEMLWANPRVVFFREEPLVDAGIGPRGAAGVALTPGRSIAVDPLSIPYGTPVWIDTSEPLSGRPLRRAVMAQDTGSAIVGAVRADYFWGWGALAEQQAGRMKQPLRMWVLMPRR